MSKGRLEAFSDGVFGIAITLLVLTIAQPSNYRNLAHELASRWPSLAAYVVSFAVIGIMWLNHHSIFTHIDVADRGLVYLNLLLLMTIAFLPYPTGVLGEALAKGQGTKTAAVVYGVTMVINAYAWAMLWLWASTRRRLLHHSFPESERRTATLLFTSGTVVYMLAAAVALLNAYIFLAIQAGLALYYAVDPISRRVTRGSMSGDGAPSVPPGVTGPAAAGAGQVAPAAADASAARPGGPNSGATTAGRTHAGPHQQPDESVSPAPCRSHPGA